MTSARLSYLSEMVLEAADYVVGYDIDAATRLGEAGVLLSTLATREAAEEQKTGGQTRLPGLESG
jgi:ABC-type amino acid transport substrate-binding protein